MAKLLDKKTSRPPESEGLLRGPLAKVESAHTPPKDLPGGSKLVLRELVALVVERFQLLQEHPIVSGFKGTAPLEAEPTAPNSSRSGGEIRSAPACPRTLASRRTLRPRLASTGQSRPGWGGGLSASGW